MFTNTIKTLTMFLLSSQHINFFTSYIFNWDYL